MLWAKSSVYFEAFWETAEKFHSDGQSNQRGHTAVRNCGSVEYNDAIIIIIHLQQRKNKKQYNKKELPNSQLNQSINLRNKEQIKQLDVQSINRSKE